MEKNDLILEYKKVFNDKKKKRVFFAPGRVNLIGGHVDYHGGKVLPCAINFGTYLVVSKRDDSKIKGYSYNFKEIGIIENNINDLKFSKNDDWFNFVKGVIKKLKEKGIEINKGFNMYFKGNIPNGAGLSSSASLELVILEALDTLLDIGLSKKEKTLVAKDVENNFIGVNCGIMDQYSIAFGKKDYAILLDCDLKTHKYVPFEIDGYKIMIINTNKERKLADSKYNERRKECKKGLDILLSKSQKEKYKDLNLFDYNDYKDKIDDLKPRIRAFHYISENKRTIDAYKKLIDNNIESFGEKIFESHKSLRDNYEVSCKELDFLVDFVKNKNSVIGARMTGAGFGGCTVNIVKEDNIDKIKKEILQKYYDEFGKKPSIYIADVGDGCKEIIKG
ncbi:MAG: galactokinase [Bacillota bacterium]